MRKIAVVLGLVMLAGCSGSPDMTDGAKVSELKYDANVALDRARYSTYLR